MCGRVLQCVAVCCSVSPYVAVCCSVFQYVVVCRRVLQCVAVCCNSTGRQAQIFFLRRKNSQKSACYEMYCINNGRADF